MQNLDYVVEDFVFTMKIAIWFALVGLIVGIVIDFLDMRAHYES